MKPKHILSTAAVFAGLISGGVLTTPSTANAQSTTSAATQQAFEVADEIASVHYEHYNVLRATLKTPISATDYYLAFSIEGMHHKGQGVIQDGKYIGFDLKLDDLVKEYPTAADREYLFDSLFIRRFSMDGSSQTVTSKMTNKKLKNELLNYQYLGNILASGSAGKVSNLIKGSSFDKFFVDKTTSADHILENGNITTKTGGIQLELNPELETDYTYALTDASGKIAGKAWSIMNNFFVNPLDGENFVSKEYTITATSDTTGDVYTLAKFTPVRIF
ncbi:hypothetical protein [Enterococcus caccae]|uniref:WxL domain-containing protein n=1 Tax=Enterococcus caccae ATCC BAA-1240 TaxID=1158612 RepID=R3WRU7_9ENTE|nr:hypothetical protein [Enterococcus caccae]EOL44540.1 hypothetical protein UC7_02083 [Enterococcus caccae ATCC BAA-1240]EOT58683.1 hypothetical protein I580_02855 [Enterococcus caccae ATCC BAA-1240]OJG25971.1 hypothetical protein RU98_GL000848 [Enterococcus caccae]